MTNEIERAISIKINKLREKGNKYLLKKNAFSMLTCVLEMIAKSKSRSFLLMLLMLDTSTRETLYSFE